MNDSARSAELVAKQRLALTLKTMQARIDSLEQARTEPIALVGIGCRLPGGIHGPDDYWRLLRTGTDAVTEVPANRWPLEQWYDANPDAPGKVYTRWGAFLDDVDQFDARFFGIAPREAVTLDPQQRLLLEVSWEALEHAGIAPDTLAGTAAGVFVGISGNDYAQLNGGFVDPRRLDPYAATGTIDSVAAGRISYVLGLTGPNLALDTACSSSLVALHLACQSLRLGECRLALAAGVNLTLTPLATVAFCKMRALSPTGRCRTFDAAADGYVRGEGCGVVVLKRLADALADGDRVLALVRGSAVNHDGRSNGLTAPNGAAQEAVLRAALANARVEPGQVGYVEAHGTGTILGDPIEVHALAAVLGRGRKANPLMLGSAKTNLGHLEAAAGVAGLIKAVLVLRHGMIPPHLHLKNLNPHIPWRELPLTVPTGGQPWLADGPRFAGVSSFGFSGTNAHVILESAPPSAPGQLSPRSVHLLSLSARSDEALRERARQLADQLARQPELSLADVCASANAGRAHFGHRLTTLIRASAPTVAALRAFAAQQETPGLTSGQVPTAAPRVAFLFTGQGAQYVGMAGPLYKTSPTFRRELDRCAEILRPHLERPLLDVLFAPEGTPSPLSQTAYAQPALLAVGYALAMLWQSWGVRPAAVLGHSLGEYTAACVAGVFSLEDALGLVATRARLMQVQPTGGGMAAVFAEETRVATALRPYIGRLGIAALNGPSNTVISGDVDALTELLTRLSVEGVSAQRLDVSHAFHSQRMEPVLSAFHSAARQIAHNAPQLTLIANLTGRELAINERLDADYWCRHLRQPVRFADSVRSLRAMGIQVFLEIGPAPTLLGMARRCLADADDCVWLPSLRRGRDDWEQLLESLAALYIRGGKINWTAFEKDGSGRRVSLPTYPFQRQRFWVEPSAGTDGADVPISGLLGRRVRATLQELVFETRLSLDAPAYLRQHRFQGAALVPAAVYLEMAPAGATMALDCEQGVVIEGLTIALPLTLPEEGDVALQLRLRPATDGATFEVSAAGTVVAAAVLRAASDDSQLGEALSDAQGRCQEEVSPVAFYQRLAERGLDLGSDFQGVEQLMRGDGEALARLRVPDGAGAYFFPPLLDACLQVFGAAVPDTMWSKGGGVLLVGLERFSVTRRPGACVWSHAVLRQGSQEAEILEGDVHIYAEDGTPIALASGLRFRRVAAGSRLSSGQRDLFYEVQWRPSPQRDQGLPSNYLASPSALAERLSPHQDRLVFRNDLAHYRPLLDQMETLSSAYFLRALRQLGWNPQPGDSVVLTELAESLGVVPVQQRLLGRMLTMLEEDGDLECRGSNWSVRRVPAEVEPELIVARLRQEYPAGATELALLARCGENLGQVLRGQRDPLTLLFPEGDPHSVEHLYDDSVSLRTYNELVEEAVAGLVERLPAGRTLRVLEVGGGTGGTTAHVLPCLPVQQTDYLFTDVSAMFLPRARIRFAAFPFVRYQVFDAEREPESQGLGVGQRDLVIAANVLHATADLRQTLRHLRRLLAPGGLLLLIETTARQRWLDLIFGLTEGWWRFTDTDLRPAYPLLDRSQWRAVLAETGFEETTAVPGETDNDGHFSRQAILIARAAPSAPAEPGSWLVFADKNGIGDHLANELRLLGQYAVLVHSGSAFARQGNSVTIDPTSPADYQRVLAECRGGDWRGVVHLGSLDAGVDESTESVAAAVAQSCRSALLLLQALVKANLARPPRLWLATAGAVPAGPGASVVRPAQAALWGLGRVASQEHAECWGGLVDLAVDATPHDAANELLGQVWQPDGENQAAFRAGVRYVARLARLTPPELTVPKQINADASYLITGGLGGLGLLVARRLAEQGARCLILVSRGVPDAATRAALQMIQETAKVVTRFCDVSQTVQVMSLLDEIRSTLPPLRGVVHAAGVFEDSTLARQQWDGFARVLAPKVSGAWNLHVGTRDLPLDFFVLFSSAASVFGPAGLGNYTAANAFLGALAYHRRGLGLPALCVDWGPWSGVGMAGAVGAERERQWALAGLDTFSAEQGLNALDRLLADQSTQRCVAGVRWNDYLSNAPAAPPLFADLALEVRGGHAQRTGQKGGVDLTLLQRLLSAEAETRPVLLLAHVRRQLARILNLDEEAVSAEGNLLELGLDSLMVMELLNGLKQTLRLTLYPREFYDRPVLAQLVRYLAAEVSRAHGAASAPPAEAKPPVEVPLPEQEPRRQRTRQRGERYNSPAVFLLSSPRSGSTLLRVMLQGHPALFSPPELHLLGFESMSERLRGLGSSYMGEGFQRALMELQNLDADGARAVVDDFVRRDAPVREAYALLQKLAGPRLLVDKTPTYASSLQTLDRAEETFEDARYIFLTRHPYAVIESFVRMRMEKLTSAADVDPLTVAEHVWATTNANVLRFFEDVEAHRRIHVRYEDLVRDPKTTLTTLCAFLGVPFDPAVLNPYEGRRMTDGVHDQSLGLNDPNFLHHDRIEAALGDAWKAIRLPRPLGAAVQKVAVELGYDLPQEGRTAALQRERSERFVDVRGLRLCMSEWGPENGPVVFCVHGILEQGPGWEEVAVRLAVQGYRIVAPDLRGHGLSAHVAASSSYQLLDFVADLDALTSLWADRRPTLVGHSLGAVLSVLLVGARPARFGALVLVEQPLPRGATDTQLASQLDALAAPPDHPVFADLAAAAARMRRATPALTEARALALAERITEAHNSGLVWRWDVRLRTRVGITQAGLELPRYLALLRDLTPVPHLVYGTSSGVLQEGQLAELLQTLPQARHVELPGGHNLHVEAPEALARVIAEASGGPRS